jgi:hypothetical protein
MPTQSFQSLDLADLLGRLEDLLQRLDRLEVALEPGEQRQRDRINAAYRQGVEDERKHRTGRDSKVERHDG